MSTDVNAIYEGGAFWPLSDQKIAVPDGQTVKITVQPTPSVSPLDVLSLAAKVYEGMTPEDIADVERIALDRSNFFRQPPDELR
jgi:predicted DNA-binding antitoxin AbrB/MazE fold protein